MKNGIQTLFPISFFQKLMIADALDPDTTALYHQNLTVRWGVRVRPSVSERTLRRVFDKLVARHDSLRLRFVKLDADWRAEILPKHPVGLVVADLSNLSPDAQTAEIEARANAPMTAFSEPMFEMLLFKCGRAGDVIVIRAHHAIIDGYSVIVLMEELLKLALNMPLPDGAGSHEVYIKQIERRAEFSRQENDRFWERALLPAPEPLRIGRFAQGLPPVVRSSAGPSHVLADVLSETESARLEAFAKSADVTPFAVLHAAFCDTLCERAGQDEVIMCSIVGRQDAGLRNFIGSDTDLIAQKYVRDGAGLVEKARHVSSANQTAVRHLPSDMLLPDSPLASNLAQQGVTLWRFAVHNSFPSGRLSSSPFKKLFWSGLTQKVSFGFMSFERVAFQGRREAIFELVLKVNYLPSGPNVTIVGDVGAYEADELAQIVQDMIGKIPT